MNGVTCYHPMSGISGIPDAVALEHNGQIKLRVDDHWLYADEIETVAQAAEGEVI